MNQQIPINVTQLDTSIDQVLCEVPFVTLEINKYGAVNLCCPGWNSVEIGNVLTEDLKAIWLGEKATMIRNSIIDGSYRYCNINLCPRLVLRELKSTYFDRLIKKSPQTIRNLTTNINDAPQLIRLAIDDSCNLVCPSCRKEKKLQMASDHQSRAKSIIKSITESFFYKSHNKPMIIGFDSSGEIFSSEVYRTAFETEKIFTETYNWPGLKFNLFTNCVLLTRKTQIKYKNLINNANLISISIDAGDKESYEKTRVGGNWELLWENIDHLYDTIRHNTQINWQWNIIAQRNNYKSIPKLFQKLNTYSQHKPNLNVSVLENWGTRTLEEYLYHAVHLPSHPEFDKYKEILNIIS